MSFRTLPLTALILIGISLVHQHAWAEQTADSLVFGFVHSPPYNVALAGGGATGFAVERARRLSHTAGYAFNPKLLPPKRYLQALRNGDVDFAFGLRDLPEYEGNVLTSEQPVFSLQLALYSTRPIDQSLPLQELLQGKKLVLIRGYAYGGLRQQITNAHWPQTIMEVTDHLQGVRALKGRQMDFLLGYDDVLTAELSANTENIKPAHTRHLGEIPLYLLVPNTNASAKALFDQLEAELTRSLNP